MKMTLVVLSLAVSTAAFAAEGNLLCRFGRTEVQGYLNGRTLDVNHVADLAGEDLNDNPVKATKSRDGLMKFELSNVDSAGDDGWTYTLYLPARPELGENEASLAIAQTDMNGTGRPDYYRGTCTLSRSRR